jgi:hypothetical protein
MIKKITENSMPGNQDYVKTISLVAILRDFLARIFENLMESDQLVRFSSNSRLTVGSEFYDSGTIVRISDYINVTAEFISHDYLSSVLPS